MIVKTDIVGEVEKDLPYKCRHNCKMDIYNNVCLNSENLNILLSFGAVPIP